MRMLITDPAQVNAHTYRRFLRSAIFQGSIAGVTTGSRYPYLNPNALVLTRKEGQELGKITEHFARIFAKAGRAVVGDEEFLMGIGFPWVFADLLARETIRPCFYGRFDFLLDRRGRWQVVEYNSDTPSGIREGVAVDEIAFRLLGENSGVCRVNDRLVPLMLNALDARLPQRRPVTLGWLTSCGHLEDMGQTVYHKELLDPHLAKRDVRTVLGDIDNTTINRRKGLCLVGREVDILYRYFPYEGLFGLPQFRPLVEAVDAGRVEVLNSWHGLLLQNKGLMAWIWAHRADPIFTAEESRTIKAHMPPTYFAQQLPSSFDRREAVVKQVFGREGAEVYLGDEMTEEDWDATTRYKYTYIVQKRVEHDPLEYVGWSLFGEPEVRRGKASAIGSFTVDEHWGGAYTRIGSDIITSAAEFVPTWVEG